MNLLAEIIRTEAAQRGVLPFDRFMELALYHPGLGYYETKTRGPGRRGDFYTSVSAGELFGQLLACRFAGWLEEMRSAECGARIAEGGAHDGKLAGDILKWLQLNRPKLFDQIEYIILEPSPRRQEWQKETLKMFAPRVRWFSDFQELAIQDTAKPAIPRSEFRAPNLSGIIFSNELLDAFPVRRFGWDAKGKKWFEWGVAIDGDKFVWARCPGVSWERRHLAGELGGKTPESAGRMPALQEIPRSELPSSILHLLPRQSETDAAPSSLLAVLPDCYTIETSPAAENWWREAAGVLARGKLLAIDYGFTAAEMFSPARTRGSLRAYFRHHATDDLLANPGEQDLTAHVNFSAIQKVGEDAGLTTEFFGSQAKFLVDILATAEKNKSFGELVASKRLVSPKSDGGGSEDGWTAKQTRQFQTLTHPEHLGRAFRVLVQSR